MAKLLAVLGISFAVHTGISCFLLLRLLEREADWRVTGVIGMALAAAAGLAKGAATGSEEWEAFVIGLLGPSLLFTAAWFLLDWGYRHPIGEPPPLVNYLWELVHDPRSLAKMIVPTVSLLGGSLAGSWLGTWIVRRRPRQSSLGANER